MQWTVDRTYAVTVTISWVVLTLCWGTLSACAQETIQWITIDFPPVWIVKGAFQGQGSADQSTAFMQSLLPDYAHRNVIMNPKRALKVLEKGRACYNSTFKNAQRDAVADYSIPISVAPVHNLIMRKSTYDQHFAGQRHLSFETLLQDTGLRFGYAAERSYGTTLSALIENYKDQEHLVTYAGQNISGKLLAMLMKKRVDYVLEYLWLMRYEFQTQTLNHTEPLVSVQIEELGAQQFFVAGFYCSKKDGFGTRILQRLTPALTQALSTTRFRGFSERWLDEGSIVAYRHAYNELLLKPQGLPPLPVE